MESSYFPTMCLGSTLFSVHTYSSALRIESSSQIMLIFLGCHDITGIQVVDLDLQTPQISRRR